MLQARRIIVERRGRKILDTVDVDAEPGKVTIIVGPNGAGKSTLLKVLSGELVPDHGSAQLDNVELNAIGAVGLASRRAVVPQSTVLSFPFTVEEVVMLGAVVPGFGVENTRVQVIVSDCLASVGLGEFSARLYTELSGGERQRVHIARALCQLACGTHRAVGSRALLFDEPTSSLDLAHQYVVLAEARRQAACGLIVVVVLHDLNLAATFADRIVLMSQGRIVASGAPAEVFENRLLSEVFGIEVSINKQPPTTQPFVLPQVFTLTGHGGTNSQAAVSLVRNQPHPATVQATIDPPSN